MRSLIASTVTLAVIAVALLVAAGGDVVPQADAAQVRDCKPLTTKRYAPPHKVTFFVGGTASCRIARKHVLRLVSTHSRTPRIRGWRCQVGPEPPHGNGECRRNGRSFYWGVSD